MKRNFFIIIFFIFGLTQNSFAYSSDPKQFIQEIVDKAKKALVETNSKELKAKKLTEIAMETVDIKGVAYYSLGNYRKGLSAEQMNKYLSLFEKYFLKSFVSRLTDYSEPKIEVLSTEVINTKYTIVKSLLVATDRRPAVNLEWIQKIYRDTSARGYSAEAVTDTILLRMHDYAHYITPQFSRTHINFQRVPTVDTSNPFIARDIPTLDESLVVIRFQDSKNVDFPYLLSMIHDSFMSRPNTIVVPGGKMGLAIELILTPLILDLAAKRKKK